MKKDFLKIGLRFYVEDEINTFSVVSFDSESMYIYSELLKENIEKPFKVSHFYKQVSDGFLTISTDKSLMFIQQF